MRFDGGSKTVLESDAIWTDEKRAYAIPRSGVVIGIRELTDDHVDLIYSDNKILRCLRIRMQSPDKDRKREFKTGDEVEKTTGDYKYRGVVVAVFHKRNGATRVCVENDDGMLFIFSEQQLEVTKQG